MTKVLFVSLGCDKNRVDSERMLSALLARGFSITEDALTAKAAVVNTCCFIHDAKEESINEIIALGRLKEEGCLEKIIVTGCLAERYREEIAKELPEVDVILSIGEEGNIADVLDEAFLKDKILRCAQNDKRSAQNDKRSAQNDNCHPEER